MKENFKLLALKLVIVAYSDLTGQLLVFWRTDDLEEVVAYKRWLLLEAP